MWKTCISFKYWSHIFILTWHRRRSDLPSTSFSNSYLPSTSYLPFYLLPQFLPPTSLSTSYLPFYILPPFLTPNYLLPPFLPPISYLPSTFLFTSYLLPPFLPPLLITQYPSFDGCNCLGTIRQLPKLKRAVWVCWVSGYGSHGQPAFLFF